MFTRSSDTTRVRTQRTGQASALLINMPFRGYMRNPALAVPRKHDGAHLQSKLLRMLQREVRNLVWVFTPALCLLLVGCGGMEPLDFANATPRFHPEKFFSGPTHSWGVHEDRSGTPTSRCLLYTSPSPRDGLLSR